MQGRTLAGLFARAVAGALLTLAAVAAPAAHAAVFDTTLVTRHGLDGPLFDGDSRTPVLSANGRYMAFESQARLDPAALPGVVNVYVKDLQTGRVELVSRAGANGPGGNGDSAGDISWFSAFINFGPSISADGRRVAFQSAATNLVAGDDNGAVDVFVRDLDARTTTLVSIARDGTSGSPEQGEPVFEPLSGRPVISADGRHVAFESHADDLVVGAESDASNIFVRDLERHTTRLVTEAGMDGAAGSASISGDGTRVAYDVYPDVYVRDLTSGTTKVIERAFVPTLSADGKWVAFFRDGDGATHVYRAPAAGAGGEELISRADGASGAPQDRTTNLGRRLSITRDGRYVTWFTSATNLVPGHAWGGLYVRDAVAHTTTLVSRASGESGEPMSVFVGGAISADASTIAFEHGSDGADDWDVDHIFVRRLRERAPSNVTRPEIAGGLRPGETARCETGAWDWADGYTYTWQLDGRPVGTGKTYVIATGDAGGKLVCIVSATNADGSRTAASAPVTVLPPGSGCPVLDRFGAGQACGLTPVVFIPGFLASEIECTNRIGAKDNLWPNALYNATEFLYMELAADGRSPGGTSRCSKTAGPSGKPVDEALGLNIHGDTLKWLARAFPGRGYSFGWDWRKSPGETIARLDTYIDQLREWHRVPQVAIYSHSMGGLLTRWYIGDRTRAGKVARAVAVGSPFWGTPKPFFTTSYGIEGPSLNPLGPDLLVPNSILKRWSRNLAGIYMLFPSRAWHEHGGVLARWLTVGGKVQGLDGAAAAIAALGGNKALLQRAREEQARHLTGLVGKQRAGVDFRVVAGAGVATLGAVSIAETSNAASRFWELARFAYTNGDGTVALASQRQALAGKKPLGEEVPVHYICGIEHSAEPEQPFLQDAVRGFLDHGGPIAGRGVTAEPCRLDASVFDIVTDFLDPRVDLKLSQTLSAARVRPPRGSASAAATSGTLSLREAEARGLVDIIASGRRTLVTTSQPGLRLELRGKRFTVRTARVTDGGERDVRVYGPIRGSATFAHSPGKPALARTAKGRALKPRRDRKPPRTRVTIRRRGATAWLTFRARDPSGVLGIYVTVGRRSVEAGKRPLKVKRSQLRKVRYSSADLLGNRSKPKRLPVRMRR